MSEKEKRTNKGIPIDNENVSKDPNRSPKGDDKDRNVRKEEGYVEPYNKKKYEQDPKKDR